MKEILTPIITEYLIPAVGAALVAIFGYIGKKVSGYIKTKELKTIAKSAAMATEQMYKDLRGDEKLAKGLEIFATMLQSKGIKTTDTELRLYLESAVGEFNNAFKAESES